MSGRSNHRYRGTNYMDDDTCEISCSCGWESTGHEDEDSADSALNEHIRFADAEESWEDEQGDW